MWEIISDLCMHPIMHTHTLIIIIIIILMITVFKEVCAHSMTFLLRVFLPLLTSMLKSTLIYFLNKFQICVIKKEFQGI